MSVAASEAAGVRAKPDLSIRAKPPSPVRLSRRVLIGGALLAGAVIAFALVSGLSERGRSHAAPEANASAATGVPETIRGASDSYGAHDLALPVEEPATRGPTEDLTLPVDGGAAPTPSNAALAERAPSAAEIARAAPIIFETDTDAAADGSGALVSRLIPPVSRYQVQAGDTIQAALVTALNSDLPGAVIARVTAPVFDSVSGDHLLIPQGARLIGTYRANATYGDRRLMLAWERLVLPNGYSIDLESMVGADASGASGLSDRTDNHLDRLIVAIGLSSLMSVVANEAEDEQEQLSFGANVADAAAQQAASTGGRIVDRELSVRPTLRVRAGAPVRVLVTRDLVLAPYRGRGAS